MLANKVHRNSNGFVHTTVRTNAGTSVRSCPVVSIHTGNSQQAQIQQEQQQQEQQLLAQHTLEMSDRGGKN
jgi:hypothetical protein